MELDANATGTIIICVDLNKIRSISVRLNTFGFESRTDKEIYLSLDIITCDHAIYTMNHPDLIVSNLMGNSVDTQRVNKEWEHIASRRIVHKTVNLTLILMCSSFLVKLK